MLRDRLSIPKLFWRMMQADSREVLQAMANKSAVAHGEMTGAGEPPQKRGVWGAINTSELMRRGQGFVKVWNTGQPKV